MDFPETFSQFCVYGGFFGVKFFPPPAYFIICHLASFLEHA